MDAPEEPKEPLSSVHASLPRRRLAELKARMPATARYTIKKEVARGGMGAILSVWDQDLRRALAMKVLLEAPLPEGGSQAEDRPLARFFEEAQVTGQLDHPGVVPVHELGVDEEGKAFFTMRLVRGRDLEQIIALANHEKEGWTQTRVVSALVRICETMAYAHNKGVLHRDLKPANVMVGSFGEVYVMDWGLARVRGEKDTHDLRMRKSITFSTSTAVQTDREEIRSESVHSPLVTMDGDVIGTPAYMPPEQANGEIDGLDERCDVYAVGAMLYHLLAKHPPYAPPDKNLNVIEVWTRVREGPPEALAKIAPEAPPELAAICEKAMARGRGDRYLSMSEMADDIRSFLEGRVVRAYEAGALAELRKWVGRNRATAFAVAAAILVTLLGSAGVAYVQLRARGALEVKAVELAAATEVARENETVAMNERERADEAAALARTARIAAEDRSAELQRERDLGRQVNGFLTSLFESPDPARSQGERVTAKELLDRGARSIAFELADDPVQRGRLMLVMGNAYRSLALYPEAQRLLDEARDILTRELGPDADDVLQCSLALGRLLATRGSHAEASELLSEVGRRAANQGDEVLALRVRHELARVHLFAGRYKEAEEEWLALRALAARSDVEIADSLSEVPALLADVYRNLGRLDEARSILEELHRERLSELGPNHPETLSAQHSLAGVYLLLNNREDALHHLAEVLESRIRVLGESHVDTLLTKGDMAYFLYIDAADGAPSDAAAKYQQAEDYFLAVIAEQERALGSGHQATLVTMSNLGFLYQDLGRLDEAEELYERAIETCAEELSDHPVCTGFLNNLAFLQFQRGNLLGAEILYQDVVAQCREIYGADGFTTLGALENYVSVLIALEDWENASTNARELLLQTGADDPQHPVRTNLFDQAQAGLARDSR